ncbi:MAG: HAMP domain-containing protein [Anaerolineae bacterium]|nr:HAMP domain-containing protein [Anaerolineae bacterium]
MSIRTKVILPFLLLTLVIAVTGVFVVTRLVADSLNERLLNQLLEAGRVVSDDFVRQEIQHVETGRIVAFTRGLSEALAEGDGKKVTELASPIAGGMGIENLVVIDRQGWELTHLIFTADGQMQEVEKQIGAGASPMVQAILQSNDSDSLPERGLGINPANGKYYYFTAIPVPVETDAPVAMGDHISGVVIVGTSLDTFLPYLKATSLADVIIYGGNGQALATSLISLNADDKSLETLSISDVEFQEIINSNEIVNGENFTTDGRWYSLARGKLRVGNDRIGVFGVVLPLNFVLQAGAESRTTYVIIFTLTMVGVVLIGFFISRLITKPLSQLVNTSRAIASGDLNSRTDISGKDEIGMLATSFDTMTTKLQDRTIELEKSNRILEQMDRTKSSFINVSAHELRTPLTLIKGYAAMLQQKADGDPELEVLSNGILGGFDRMHEIVNNMLDVSKIDSDSLKIIPTNSQLGLVIAKAHNNFKPVLEERKLSFTTAGLETIPMVSVDPDLIYKVFYHLIMNAIKYTPDGGNIHITGKTFDDAPDGPEVEIAIKDSGIGIASQNQELVFDTFYQTGEVMLHSSGKTKFKGGGPGLGLAIARGIVEAHHGRIWLESPGHDEKKYPGSTFYVRLPVQNGR